MNARFAIAFLAAIVAGPTFGQVPTNYQCSYADLIRRVEIVYETGVAVPCEVHYYKDTEAPGERQVLWTAYNESGYCESKTQELIANLQSMGWNCGAAEVTEPVDNTETRMPADVTEGAEIVDDTETLMPGEPAASTEDSP